MRYRKLDENQDMRFGNNQMDFFRDSPETVSQAILTRLKLWKGEWFLDVEEGTPYQQAVLGTNKSKSIGPAIRSRILNTQGVLNIESFNLNINPDTREAFINATVNTIYGQTVVQGIL